MSDQFGMPMVDCRPTHEVITELRQRLTKINDTIYAVGAPLGSEAYFTIRKICCDNMKEN